MQGDSDLPVRLTGRGGVTGSANACHCERLRIACCVRIAHLAAKLVMNDPDCPKDFKLDLLRRPRRLRRSKAILEMNQETWLRREDLIAPLFVIDGDGIPEKVESMPGVLRRNISDLVQECRELQDAGIRAMALFPSINPSLKDEEGTESGNPDNLLLRSVKAIKEAAPELVVVADLWAMESALIPPDEGASIQNQPRR